MLKTEVSEWKGFPKRFTFDKISFFNGKSIRQEKGRGKEKSRAEGKETKGVFFSIQAGIERPFFWPLGD